MDPMIICGVVTVIGILVGIVIGYYKTKAEFARDYVSKDDCEDCPMKDDLMDVVEEVGKVTEDLQQGRKVFKTIEVDILLIKIKLGIKSDLDELKAAIITLENVA